MSPRTAFATCLVTCLVSMPGCALLTGLDQITESACAPNCGADSSIAQDVTAADADASTPDSPPNRADGSAEAPGESAPDARERDSSELDVGTSADAVSEDSAAIDALPDTSSPPDATDAGPCGIVYLSEPFDDNSRGWTLDTTWTVASTCASPPAPQKGNPDPTVDHTTGQPGGVAGAFVCGNNPAGQKSAARYVTSPAVDVSAAPAVVVTFYRWLNSDAATYMTSTVDVFDGASWINVYTNPSGSGNIVADAVWTKQQFDVTAHRNAAFRVRFGYAVISASVYSMSCWNVDDVTVSSVACP